MKSFKYADIMDKGLTKADLIKKAGLQDVTFDYSLPQGWLDHFSDISQFSYNEILSTTVWIYPENKPFSVCLEIQNEIESLSY